MLDKQNLMARKRLPAVVRYNKEKFFAFFVDIDESGAILTTRRFFASGQKLDVECELMRGRRLRLKASVASTRVQVKNYDEQLGYLTEIKWNFLTDSQQETFSKYLEELEKPPSKRRTTSQIRVSYFIKPKPDEKGDVKS